ncbi:MAG: 50S ribosomal protein L11 methyltransferase [Syntrophales bacterium]|nr:50S ribosomal protein L11 methyltransferase [Syntrophales bacterium]MDD5640807.1 50S ribosomal protein L11 methyltransferase [Syntrophales bacterium]
MPAPEKIYVYEVQGKVTPPEALCGDDFLGAWREGDYSYLFFSNPKEGQVQAWLKTTPAGVYSSETVLNYADWEAGQPFKPLSIAGLHFSPIWEEPAPPPGETLIRMEPGLAFGSGYHPTSKLCLELMRRLYEKDTPREVLDLGSGTGILALAALALGAHRVIAVEYNELAVRTAAKNVRHNHREQEILLIQGDARHFAHLPGDLVLANIHLDVLLDLLKIPEFLTKKYYIFSGVLGTQMERFREALAANPLKEIAALDENLWFAVLAVHEF